MTKTRYIIFTLVPVLILLLILEVAGRVIYPFDTDKRGKILADRDPRISLSYLSSNGVSARTILEDIHSRGHRYIPFLGWIGRPNMKLSTISNNNLGFRDREIESRKQNEFRVLLLGGSTAWGFGASSNERTLAGSLESRLNQDSGTLSYRVFNGAYPAWSSRHELIALMEFYELFDPDLVISLTGANDLAAIAGGKGKDIFMRPEGAMLAEAVENSLRPMGTYQAIRKFAGSLGIWRIVVYFREIRPDSNKANYQFDYDEDRAGIGVWKVVDRYIAMSEYATSRDSNLIVVLQPSVLNTGKMMNDEEMGVKKRMMTTSALAPDVLDQYRGKYIEELMRHANDGLRVFDFKNIFDDVTKPVFIDNSHLNDDGYDILAQALEKIINSAREN